MNNISDFELLATAANYIKEDLIVDHSIWDNSPFNWLLNISPSSKGKLGKHLIFQWCALKGLSVDRSPDYEADMLINGIRVEVKFSMLWNQGFYKFQQIRDQNYQFAICLGISPSEAHCWVIKKEILLEYVIGHMGQHTGSTGQDTSWLTVYPERPYEWLRQCGGRLEEAILIIRRISK